MYRRLFVKAQIRKHLWYYSTFIILQLAGLALVLSVASDKTLQLTMIVLTAGIYMIWALFHQHIHHTLTAKIAAEYILFGIFGIAISFFVL